MHCRPIIKLILLDEAHGKVGFLKVTESADTEWNGCDKMWNIDLSRHVKIKRIGFDINLSQFANFLLFNWYSLFIHSSFSGPIVRNKRELDKELDKWDANRINDKGCSKLCPWWIIIIYCTKTSSEIDLSPLGIMIETFLIPTYLHLEIDFLMVYRI